ncbi:hypothetical protein K501DRAFT_183603 [Backusella circina FSU 941]|nr:hypothetical protein K501DRAFT_183603 [Backusella circina FSU 941]
MATLSSREHWFKNQRSNSILPLQFGSKRQDSSSSSKNYGSPVKRLIPSISTFNVPPDNETPAVAETPPPQFAVENEERRFRFRRRKEIVKGYPSAFETYLFDDATPGVTSKGIQPVRLLIERLEAWCLLSKRLLHHFERILNYNQIEDRYPSRLLQIHFAFTGGIRGVCDAWQTYHTDASKDHSEFATFLRSEAIPALSNIKRELKWMIKSIRGDDRLSLGKLTTLKQEAARRLKRLDRQLVFFNEHPYHGYCKIDPWLVNAGNVC